MWIIFPRLVSDEIEISFSVSRTFSFRSIFRSSMKNVKTKANIFMTISVGGGTGPVLVSISLQNENRKIPGNIESETQRRKELKKYFNIY